MIDIGSLVNIAVIVMGVMLVAVIIRVLIKTLAEGLKPRGLRPRLKRVSIVAKFLRRRGK